ncbi:uncharacterized protein BDR25DRAFT_313661 [Lindgomyces ingoldianus]|uniref:Uncharacterized protein n=1 Tax=Lindgomyces ingoldianus TaxID=673940 RepID=A0ACB6QYZ4_9PLEO|nr:uncharacterized protein BDR25DRAFT_313661 [Lindgomyces ingoldianus]KAF2471760.1 hypothetical protein BDR25DRAFT_313661 [Lindgomyces ingoldianus]
MGNPFNPVTPDRAAVNMSKLYISWKLLTQDIIGHISFLTYLSCATGHMASYLTNETLPAEGTNCQSVGTTRMNSTLLLTILSPIGSPITIDIDVKVKMVVAISHDIPRFVILKIEI